TDFKKKFPKSDVSFLPSFHENEVITAKTGKGNFLLYHGKLSVPENELAAEFLIENVFSKIKYKVKIAGMDPSKNILHLASSVPNIELIANPDEKEMKNLISEAQVHCLYTHQNTGLKLKLLNVLFQGRHVLVNKNMTHGTTLGSACHYAEHPEEWCHAIERLMKTEFTKEEISKRGNILEDYSNAKQIEKLISVMRD
ncbi:MAG: glycosyltransferase family 1 protein, partial [Bacteroidota bacterium]